MKGIDRTKQDEDIAERVIGGVRTDRTDVPRWSPDRDSASDRQPRNDEQDHPRQR